MIDTRELDDLGWIILGFWVVVAMLVLLAFLAAASPAAVLASRRTGSRLAGIATGTVAGLVTLGAYAWAIQSDQLAQIEGRWIAVCLMLANYVTVAYLGVRTRRGRTATGDGVPDDRGLG